MQYPVVDNNGHVNDLVQEQVRNLDGFLNSCNCGRRLSPPHLHLRICTTGTPGTSTTLSEESNCGTTVFSTVWPRPLSFAQQRACRRPTKNCAVQHSVDERNLRYLPLNRRGLLELVVHGHRDVQRPHLSVAQNLCTALGWRCIPPGVPTGCEGCQPSRNTPQWAPRPGTTRVHQEQ